jgi:hypothetical protein
LSKVPLPTVRFTVPEERFVADNHRRDTHLALKLNGASAGVIDVGKIDDQILARTRPPACRDTSR